MNIEIKHRCGRVSTWWAPDAGGYVRRTTSSKPGALGTQPTIHGSTLMCGPSEKSLRRAVRRYLRHASQGEDGSCACGEWHD